jgi:bifunctional DNA primase/polymerase-like protein/primase-like protein
MEDIFADTEDALTRRANHLSIHTVKQSILVAAGIDGKNANTIAAIIACQPVRQSAFTPFKAANGTIGRKLCRNAEKDSSFRKAAQRDLYELFNEAQPKAGIEFITRLKGSFDPKKEKHLAASYIDNLTPVADVVFQSVTTSDDYKAAKKVKDKRDRAIAIATLFHEAIGKALKGFPVAERKPFEWAGKGRKKLTEFEKRYRDIEKSELEVDELIKLNHLIVTKIQAKTDTQQEGSGSIQWDTCKVERMENPGVGQGVSPAIANSNPINPDSHISAILDAGESYLAQGFALVENYGVSNQNTCLCANGAECKDTGKHPRGGLEMAKIKTMEELSKRAQKRPEMNLGIATGASSGIVVLDYDLAEGLRLREEHRDLGLVPETMEARTGSNGQHALIKYFPGLQNKIKARDGLDVLTDGFQILVYPSRNKNGAYRWIDTEAEIIEASEDLKGYLLEVAGKKEKESIQAIPVSTEQPHGLGNQEYYRHGYQEGARNNGLFGVACALRGKRGGTFDEILAELRRRNSLCLPPQSDAEIVKIATSACKYSRMMNA